MSNVLDQETEPLTAHAEPDSALHRSSAIFIGECEALFILICG